MSDGELVIRPFRPGDEQAVLEGFNEAFHLERSLPEWSWKFQPEPGSRYIMLAERDGELLAHYAAVPVRFQIRDRVWNAGQIVDVFSTRKARGGLTRRGVWVRTVDSFFDAFGRSGRLPLLFGYPSPRALRLGVLQLGYDQMELQPIRYLARRSRGSARRGRRLLYRAELARDWEPRLDALWQRLRHQYPVAVVRDASHALRRYAGHPMVRYHRFLIFPRLSTDPVAFAVFRSDGGVIRWADLLWDHHHPGALDLVDHLSAQLAVQTAAEREELWMNGDPEGRERLEAGGFQTETEPGRLVMGARAFDDDVDLATMGRLVYTTMGDSDLV